MPKWSNINVKMERNACYSQSISGRSILKPGIGTLSDAPGFAVIAAMDTAIHIQKDSVMDKVTNRRLLNNIPSRKPAPGHPWCGNCKVVSKIIY